MTSWHSLQACPQADVTIERLTALAATTGTEPLTVDFKEKADRRPAPAAAARDPWRHRVTGRASR
jgi:hypothetical protein